jgi:hypothetical protein
VADNDHGENYFKEITVGEKWTQGANARYFDYIHVDTEEMLAISLFAIESI